MNIAVIAMVCLDILLSVGKSDLHQPGLTVSSVPAGKLGRFLSITFVAKGLCCHNACLCCQKRRMPHRVLKVVSFLSGCRPFQGLSSESGYHDSRHEWADFPQRQTRTSDTASQVPALREDTKETGVFKGLGDFPFSSLPYQRRCIS